jgi:hypothetical protein
VANTYRNVAGLNPEDVYDPDMVGDGPTASIAGIGYKNAAGVLLKFAKLSYGTAAANHGYRLADGRDFSALWAKKGTAVYTLGFNGGSYASSRVRSTASLALNMKSDGTWSVVREQGDVGEALLASGSWLNFGGTVADYTVKFTMAGFISGPDEGGGTDSYANGAAAPTALTSTRAATASAAAVLVGNTASNGGTVTAYLYKAGVLVSTNTCSFACDSTGTG